MTEKKIIEQAIRDIALAEALVDQAKQTFSNARKALVGLHKPVGKRKMPVGFEIEAARILAMRQKRTTKHFLAQV